VERKGCGTRKILNAAGLAGALALALIANTARAQAQPNVEELMARVGERVAEFYNRATNVICISRRPPYSLSTSITRLSGSRGPSNPSCASKRPSSSLVRRRCCARSER
jgi:hypothetical protein